MQNHLVDLIPSLSRDLRFYSLPLCGDKMHVRWRFDTPLLSGGVVHFQNEELGILSNRIYFIVFLHWHKKEIIEYLCKKLFVMNYSAYINLGQFNEEARRELRNFIDFLTYKYNLKKKNKTNSKSGRKQFTALSLDTRGFTFIREEANER